MYTPKNKIELRSLIENNNIYLGDIDTSLITDMSMLFDKPNFSCFEGSYNEYENYNVRIDFSGIEKWNVSNVKYMTCMFKNAVNFDQDLNAWKINNEADIKDMFINSSLIENPYWYNK